MLDFFFKPDGVAILGASKNVNKGGYRILKNFMSGYRGKIYPVNPNYLDDNNGEPFMRTDFKVMLFTKKG
jgi:acyl-CoA synthetase (NDP forming)